MKKIVLSKSGALKVNKLNFELFFSDIEGSIKSCLPGEWVEFYNSKRGESFLGFINPLVDNSSPCGYILTKNESSVSINPSALILDFIAKAINKRSLYKGYGENSRLIYGGADFLPGLIVDSFENVIIIQINTAGIDLFRQDVKEFFRDRFPSKEIFLLDNPVYRMREGLPVYEENQSHFERIFVTENNLKLSLDRTRMQKIGFYYDHRENRNRLKNFLTKYNGKVENGLDLFCYVGAWGMTLLQMGVNSVGFVDQGDFEKDLKDSLERSSLQGEAIFFRDDVFKFLKDQRNKNSTYDIICSDPPAFCKSQSEKKRAYDGYLKLHELCLSLLKPNSLLVACSCTHYIEMEEFVKNVNEAAIRSKRNIQLLDVGIQGFDHPIRSLNDKQNYLKYTLFFVE